MRRALAVAGLELREWRALPVMALAAGLLPLVIAWAHAPAALIGLANGVPELCWVGTALAAGASTSTRDMRERRATFLLARPLLLKWIWTGKLLAALAAAAAATVLAWLPTWLRDGAPFTGVGPEAALKWLTGTLLLMGIGHWIALAFTARGWRLLADASLSVGLIGAVLWLGVRLKIAGAPGYPAAVPAVGWLVTLALAGAVGLAHGRGDRARSYGSFALTHWIGLGMLAIGLAVNLRWIRSVEPSELVRPLIFGVSPDGRWLHVVGRPRWPPRAATPGLLVQVAGGSFVNLGRGAFWEIAGSAPAFSSDGRWCAWSVFLPLGGAELRVVELSPDSPVRSRPTPMKDARPDAVPLPRLSPTGRALLLFTGQGWIEVLSGDDLRTLWSQAGVEDAGFLDDRTVWVLRRGSAGRELVWLSADSGQRLRVAELGDGKSRLILAPDGERALALTKRELSSVVELCDLGGGGCRALWENLPTSTEGPVPPWKDAAEGAFLSDGGAVVSALLGAGSSAERGEVRAFEADGRPRWTLSVPPARRWGPFILLGEPRPQVLLVHVAGYRVLVVDARSGRVVRSEEGLVPRRPGSEWAHPFGQGLAATFFTAGEGGIVRVDPETWIREPVTLRSR